MSRRVASSGSGLRCGCNGILGYRMSFVTSVVECGDGAVRVRSCPGGDVARAAIVIGGAVDAGPFPDRGRHDVGRDMDLDPAARAEEAGLILVGDPIGRARTRDPDAAPENRDRGRLPVPWP